MTRLLPDRAPCRVDELLRRARRRLARLSPQEAFAALEEGALLVDIRPHAQRLAEGEVPGALVLERNVLEWRFDPSSGFRVEQTRPDLWAMVLCSEGYTSSLAATALQDVGLARATDVIGGFVAWRAAGLPTVPGGTAAGQCSPMSDALTTAFPMMAPAMSPGTSIGSPH